MPVWGWCMIIGFVAIQLFSGYTIFHLPERPGDVLGRFPSLIHRDEEPFAYWVSVVCQLGILVLYLIIDQMAE